MSTAPDAVPTSRYSWDQAKEYSLPRRLKKFLRYGLINMSLIFQYKPYFFKISIIFFKISIIFSKSVWFMFIGKARNVEKPLTWEHHHHQCKWQVASNHCMQMVSFNKVNTLMGFPFFWKKTLIHTKNRFQRIKLIERH